MFAYLKCSWWIGLMLIIGNLFDWIENCEFMWKLVELWICDFDGILTDWEMVNWLWNAVVELIVNVVGKGWPVSYNSRVIEKGEPGR